jgi:hypothetical protein
MFDSLIKMGTSALLGSALGPAAPIVSSLIGNAVSGGGSDPLQSLLGAIGDPFKALFGQATSQLTSPFRSIPAAFQGSAVTGSAGDLLRSAGDLDGQEKKALELLQSDKIGDQLAGKQLLDKVNRLKDLLFKLDEIENARKKKAIDGLN